MPPLHQTPRLARFLVAVAAVTTLGLGTGVAATPVHALSAPVEWEGMRLDDGGAAIVNDFEHVEISPGLDQIEFERIGAEGRQQIHVLRVALADSNLYVDYLGNEAVTQPGTVSEFVDGAGAIAGVNGDFFDINNSSAPLGVAISRENGVMKSAEPSREAAAAFSESGLGRVAQIFVEGSITTPGGSLPLNGINTLGSTREAITVYTPRWGDHTRTRSIPAGAEGVEVVVGADGTVRSPAAEPDSAQLAEGELALVTIQGGSAASALEALRLGDEVSLEYRLNDDNADIRAAVSGHPTSEPPMLQEGVIGEATSDYMRTRNPRTGVGFTADGTTAYFVVVDGRQADAAGMTVPELGSLMRDLGAWTAINLDGGGSSQLNSREPGDRLSRVQNSPSDGYERSDANGLGIFLRTPGSGVADAYDLRPALTDADAVRVFPGLTRTLGAFGYDETGSAVDEPPADWSVGTDAATVAASDDGRATVTGVGPGSATVTAARGDASGSLELTVLGEVQRLSASSGLVAFGNEGETRSLTVIGHDADGFQAPIEPGDVEVLDVAGDLLSFEPAADGTFRMTALRAPGSATATFRVGAHEVRVPITVGLDEVVFADLSDASSWAAANDRAPGGSVEPAEGHAGAAGLRIAYDFTQSTATRGQYAVAPDGGYALPGQPQKVTAWIHGDGEGAWPRLQVRQANGTTSNLNGPNITWTGWQRAEFEVPAGVSYPLQFQRVRIMETRAGASYTGEVRISHIAAAVAPDVEMPETSVVEDPVVAAEGTTADAPLRVAVMSDAQFVARDPDSEMVTGARRALREIAAAEPDLLVINGDFVDEAAPEDFALARRILDEELGGVTFPWYYVPGNHEVMGGAIANFEAAFGESFRSFDQEGTRFVLLDTSTGSLSARYEQVRMLHDALNDAETDPAISGVVVMQHHPIDDPLPTKASQLSNRLDASMLRDWFEDFRASSGKSIGLVASHVGVFHATREDGVPYLINGNSGKAPAGSDFGDFTGWTMLGIDPAQGLWETTQSAWLESEVKVRVDELRLGVEEAQLIAGETASLTPVIDQPGRTGIDVAWPMSYRWSGDGLFVGDPADAPEGTVAALDPRTHVLTALRSGTVDATLTVNGVSETATVGVRGGLVSITGEPRQGETLGADLDDWPLPDGSTVAYAWLRDGEEIVAATDASYLIGPADAGAALSVRVTVALPDAAPVVVVSPPTVQVPFLDITGVTPWVSGTAQVGSMLTAVPGRWLPEQVELTYQWAVDSVAVPGAVGSTFTPTAEHVGAEVTVTVTGSAPGHSPQSRTSAPLGPIAGAPAPGTPSPEISLSTDRVEAGGTLTVSGQDFSPGTSVEILLHPGATRLGTADVAASGSFSATVVVPADTLLGTHSVRVLDPVTETVATATVTVVAADGQPTTGDDPAFDGALPVTGGAAPWSLLGGGAAAFLLGAAAFWAARRRSAV